ncbi:hypothetical protein SASPL_101151 [Salvia splendens]|uniref:Uncharacterized protein n=1 Tax=Salvia splendens TaxID=180675 RepID=A0A8X8YUA9_SALSN|nr:hypothetical protein SASPL_101151 [Salvia splendens]
MAVSPVHDSTGTIICKKLKRKIATPEDSKAKYRNAIWEAKRRLVEQRLMNLDHADQTEESIPDETAIVVPKDSPTNDVNTSVGVSSSTMERAQEVQSNLSQKFPSFIKLMLKSHVSGGFWLFLELISGRARDVHLYSSSSITRRRVGRTDPMCSLPTITDPIISPAAESPPLEPIRTILEHLVASVARVEARMDEYEHRPPPTLPPPRPEPKPPHNRPRSHPLDAATFAQPLSVVSVAVPQQSSSGAWTSDPWPGFGNHLSSGDLPPSSRPQPTSWDLPPASRQQHTSQWGQPPSSHNPTALEPWGNRFPDLHVPTGHPSWEPAGHRHQASLPAAEYHSWVHQQLPPQPVLDQPSPPFSAVSVATAPFIDINEGFRPNPSGASGSRRTGPADRLIQQELQSMWDLPPASRPHSAWDKWENRFSEPYVYSGGSSWDPPGQRQPACMDEYDRRPSSSRLPNQPEPDPPYTRVNHRPMDVNVPHIPPFSAISSATPSYIDPYSQPQYYTDPYTDPYYENIVSERSTSSAEEVVSGELYNLPENGDLPAIQEENVHVSKNVVEARDEAEPVIENPTIIDEAPKKSYAPIARHLKVHIVRERSFTENAGVAGLPNLCLNAGPIKEVKLEEEVLITKTARKCLKLICAENGNKINDIHPSEAASVDENDYPSTESMNAIRFSESVVSFKDVKGFTDFSIHVDGLMIDAEIPLHLRGEYYEICRSQNKFLHENLMKGFNTKLAAGMISETINIAGAIRAVTDATADHLHNWDTTLKAFEDLGMEVGFLRARIDKLLSISRKAQATIKLKRQERAEAKEETRRLNIKLLDVKVRIQNLDAEIDGLVKKNEEQSYIFREVLLLHGEKGFLLLSCSTYVC